VALARILVAKPDLALLDEPTNHLDIETIEWLEAYFLESYRGALLLVTHDRYVLDRVAQRIVELERGQLVGYPGSYERYLELKAERLSLENRIEANRRNYLRSEMEWLRRQPKARTGKQKARIQRAEEVIAAPKPHHQREVDLKLSAVRSGKTILEIEDLFVAINDRVLVRDLDLHLIKGQRVGILGPNGCGKTTLLRTIVGELEPTAGSIRLGKQSALSYLSQARDGLDPQKTVWQNVSGGDQHVIVGDRTLEVQSYLGRFLFSSDSLQQPVSALSGGERTRVALAKLLLTTTNLLILDEPANDLDVPTLRALEQMLIEFGGTALVVTHDRWFLDRVATSVLAFEEDGKVAHYAGNYSDYRAQRAQAKALLDADENASRKSPKATNEEPPKKPRSRRALTYAERLELQGLEAKIDAADLRVADLERQLADPRTYALHRDEITQLAADLEEAKHDAALLFARWEELETKQEVE
jgi:ABC transport system ATP-binding/permease protein